MTRTTRRKILAAFSAAPAWLSAAKPEPRLRNSFRKAPRNGWVHVRLEGAPAEIGFQHGYWMAAEIAAAHRTIAFEMERDSRKPWSFYRAAAKEHLWPRVEAEYREEIEGIAAGIKARRGTLDLWDAVALNAWLEWSPYFLDWHNAGEGAASPAKVTTADRCSAFVATGAYTADGRPVIGHNAWTAYSNGVFWNIIFEIYPAKGHSILMDGYPGLIHSGDDFGVNSAGIAITETTITQFSGWDPEGIPEFVRARKAMQYSRSIDDFARLMRTGNNGGYANNWLVADCNTGEIADLELGLKNVTLRRTQDGYFAGSNFPVSEKLAREETKFDLSDRTHSANTRRVRWDQLMAQHKGRIDAAAAQRFLSDHYDVIENIENPSERTLCGHIDLSPRGLKPWADEYAAVGAVQAKAASAEMLRQMSFSASQGHSCGIHFKAAQHLAKHKQFEWQKPYLRDLPSRPWTVFQASRQPSV
ncbi:MAG: peptidase C45 [Bryobacterales bacterium]|nr:peptidase C45 [Bryobacterales bacterium]